MAEKVSRAPRQRADSLHHAKLAVAQQILEFARTGYGPRAGHKLIVDGDDHTIRSSPAAALREIQAGDALVRPYKNLASSVQASVGDAGTTAILLAARLVALAMDRPGLPVGAVLDGYQLAKRQALGVLAGQARPAPPATLLHALGESDTVRVVLDGLAQLGWDLDGALDLDRVDIRVEPGECQWLEGVVVEPKAAPDQRRIPDGGVLLLTADVAPKVQAAQSEIRSARALEAIRAEERERRRQFLHEITRQGIQLLACRSTVPEDLVHDLAQAGVLVVDNCAQDAMQRLAAATGARAIPRVQDVDASHIGKADALRRHHRRGGWLVTGPGPSATLTIDAPPGHQESAVDAMERLLRAAGPVLADPRGLPGGGAWQLAVAKNLRKAAPLAPGKQALAMGLAADAFEEMAHDLVTNQGLDPWLHRGSLDAPPEPFVAVEYAIHAAFEVAAQVLRLDGRIDKSPSNPADLRGGLGPSGSPKGMPGDVPPLM